MRRSGKAVGATAITLLLCGAAAGFAQTAVKFPTKPVRLVVGFSPGSATDITARTFAPKLSELWGQPVVIENRFVRLPERTLLRRRHENFGQPVAIDIGGTMIKARTSSARQLSSGDNVGLNFDGPKLSLFEEASGRAIRSALYDGGLNG